MRRLSSILIAAAMLAGCSGAQEHALLGEFFSASRLRDNTALARLATVRFEPTTQGIITKFDIVGVTDERREAGSAIVSKDVAISAPVKLPSGETVRKRLVVTMQREADSKSGWIVSAIRDEAAASSPQS
jgi:hypothetical protein